MLIYVFRSTTILPKDNLVIYVWYYVIIFINFKNFQVAGAINSNSPNVVSDLIANLKIVRQNSVGDIGFRMPLGILLKYTENNKSSVLSSILESEDITSESNSNSLIIRLNKSDFINDVLKNDMINQIPHPQLQNSKPRIIEFR